MIEDISENGILAVCSAWSVYLNELIGLSTIENYFRFAPHCPRSTENYNGLPDIHHGF
jgi:hypothetical protein